MLVLITGGAKNGKSYLGESICSKINNGKLLYIATMDNSSLDTETAEKIAAHRKMRSGKGFATLEKYTDLHQTTCAGYDTVLLECVTNWAANEMFQQNRQGNTLVSHILQGTENIARAVSHLVMITSDVSKEVCRYSDKTEQYRQFLMAINISLARRADVVLEAVCGLPVLWKGRLP